MMILKTALSHSIRTIWALVCGMAGLALVTTILIGHYDLNQKLATGQGLKGQGKTKKKDGEAELASAVVPHAVIEVDTGEGGEEKSIVSGDTTTAIKTGESRKGRVMEERKGEWVITGHRGEDARLVSTLSLQLC